MRIKDIRASVHEFPITVPLIDEPLEQRRIVFCEVETDDGHTGVGLTSGAFLPFGVVAALHNDFLPLLRDMDPAHLEEIHLKVWKSLNPRTMTGVISSALSCLDIALWDILGKAAGKSVAELLGGARSTVPAYITFGFPEYDTDQLVEAANSQVSAGHSKLKLVVGVHKDGYKEDARRVRAVRDAIGPDVELMIDANYMFSPVEALLLCNEVAEYGVTWFEEPLYSNDARALADLRNRTSIPLAAGQMEGHRWRLRELVERHAVDILQPNVCYCGGYTEGRKAAHVAQAFNLPIANGGGWPRFNLHLQAGMMNGWRVEFHLGMKFLEDTLFVDPPDPIRSTVTVSDKPGLGLDVRPGILAHSLVQAD